MIGRWPFRARWYVTMCSEIDESDRRSHFGCPSRITGRMSGLPCIRNARWGMAGDQASLAQECPAIRQIAAPRGFRERRSGSSQSRSQPEQPSAMVSGDCQGGAEARVAEASEIDRRVDGIDLCQAGPFSLGSGGRSSGEMGRTTASASAALPSSCCGSAFTAIGSSAVLKRATTDADPN